MTILICDRCGDVTVADNPCRCAVPYDPIEVRRRHQHAVARARSTDALVARMDKTPRAA